MKAIKYIPFLLLFVFAHTPAIGNPTEIRGSLSPEAARKLTTNGAEFKFYNPIGGYMYNSDLPEDIPVDTINQAFLINVDISVPIFARLQLMGTTYQLYLVPEKSITLDIAIDKNERWHIKFGGDLKTENEYYNSMHTNYAIGRSITKYMNDEIGFTPTPEYLSAIRKMIRQGLKPLDSLLQEGQIDDTFYEIAALNLRCRYIMNGLAAVSAKNYMSEDSAFKAEATAVLFNLFEDFEPLSDLFIRIPNAVGFLGTYTGEYSDIPSNAACMEPYALLNNLKILAFLPEPIREYRYGKALIFEYTRKNQEFDFSEGYELFVKHYPNSVFLPVIRELLNEGMEVAQREVIYANPDTLEVTDNISYILRFETGSDTLQGAIKQLSDLPEIIAALSDGKPAYIDFWATWCVPCIQEFPHSIQIHGDLRKKGIIPIYISTDGVEHRQKWEAAIRRYKLHGYHVLISKKTNDQLRQEIGLEMIPRYLIVDRFGNISNPDAPRPSMRTELYTELQKVIIERD